MALSGAIMRTAPAPRLDAVGYADVAAQTPMPRDARFRIGSLSKLITAVLCHQLTNGGALDPQASVTSVLGYNLGTARVRDLLANRSGLEVEVDGPWPGIDSATLTEDLAPAAPVPADTVAALLAPARIASPDGAFEYMTANYWILGRILEAVSGESYFTLAQRYVLAPLGLESVRYASSFPDARATDEVSYEAAEAAVLPPAAALGLRDAVPAAYAPCVPQRDAMGGWAMTVSDLTHLTSETERLLATDAARDSFWGRHDASAASTHWHYGQGAFRTTVRWFGTCARYGGCLAG